MTSPLDILRQQKLAVVVQAPERPELIVRAKAAIDGGIKLLALPVSVPFVAEIAAEVSDLAPDVVVGLSDVVLPDHANVALAAGAEFVLSPVFDFELIEHCGKRGLSILPSISTPTEAHHASRGYDGPVGVYPSEARGGSEFTRWVARALPHIEMVPWGGVTSDVAPSHLELGAIAVVVDSGFFPKDMDPQAVEVIAMRASALIEMCAEIAPGERLSFI